MSPPSGPSRPGRRAFLRALGRASLSSALALPALAQAPPPPSGAARRPAPGAPDTSSATPPPPAAPPPAPPAEQKAPSEDARALAAIIQRRYGAHLAPEDLDAVTRSIDARLEGGARLRAARLENADEPDVVFRAGAEHA